MNITCQNCQTKLNIPENKILKDKDSVFKCPKCKEKVIVPLLKKPAAAPEKKAPQAGFSFAQKQNALICIDDPAARKSAFAVVNSMEFNAEMVMDVKDAMERMEYHIYHLVILDERFDESSGAADLLAWMNEMDMSLRRRICLVLISDNFNSNDGMSALHTSVNDVVNREDIAHLNSFLTQILQEHANFYHVFNQSLKQAGKI